MPTATILSEGLHNLKGIVWEDGAFCLDKILKNYIPDKKSFRFSSFIQSNRFQRFTKTLYLAALDLKVGS